MAVFKRFICQPSALVGAVFLLVLAVLALTAPWLTNSSPWEMNTQPMLPPLHDADAALTPGAPLLTVAEPALFLFALALRAAQESFRQRIGRVRLDFCSDRNRIAQRPIQHIGIGRCAYRFD